MLTKAMNIVNKLSPIDLRMLVNILQIIIHNISTDLNINFNMCPNLSNKNISSKNIFVKRKMLKKNIYMIFLFRILVRKEINKRINLFY